MLLSLSYVIVTMMTFEGLFRKNIILILVSFCIHYALAASTYLTREMNQGCSVVFSVLSLFVLCGTAGFAGLVYMHLQKMIETERRL